jgi:Ni,Fe-hydrogenase III large subunit
MDEELHALDRRIDEIRRRIWMVRQGLVKVDDPDAEVARLDAEYREIGDRFVEAYRAWSKESDS